MRCLHCGDVEVDHVAGRCRYRGSTFTPDPAIPIVPDVKTLEATIARLTDERDRARVECETALKDAQDVIANLRNELHRTRDRLIDALTSVRVLRGTLDALQGEPTS